jgi:membrane fusion protein, multidrug efflux system
MTQRQQFPRTPSSILFIALCLGGLVSCKAGFQGGGKAAGDEKKAEVTAIPVEVGSAHRDRVTATFQGTAALQAEAEAQVIGKTGGVILAINVEEGDRVAKGQILARLDSDRQRLNVAQARANYAKLENDYKRQQELFARKLIGSDAFERSKFDLETQKAQYDIAVLELSYTEVRAPITGVVSLRLVKLGNLIQPNTPLFRIDDFDPLEAVLNVPEREMRNLHPGQPVQMLVDALPGMTFSGSVARVSPVVDAQSGTFKVTAAFKDGTGQLRSGMFGRVNVVTDTRENALVIPRESLLGEDVNASVYLVEGDSVKRQNIKLGYVGGGIAEVLEGVKDGQMVVTLGQAAIRDGSKVVVLSAEKPATTAPVGTDTPALSKTP